MTLEACAELVETADPDRYAVTITAPLDVQKILWPLYAFNIEVSRAPWVTQEPMIAEIRLQWWRDALEEIRESKPVRAHFVTGPLADILDAEGAMMLDKLVEARAWDIYADAFPNRESFDAYIELTYSNLYWTAARLIAPDTQEQVIRKFAYSCGIAAMLRATAKLKSLGKSPLFDDSIDAFGTLAEQGFVSLSDARQARKTLPKALDPLLMTGWNASPTFAAVRSNAEAVYAHGFRQSEFSRRLRLFKLSVLGWWR